MPVVIGNKHTNIPSLSNMDNNTIHMDQFLKLIGNISSFNTIHQLQQFMVEFIYILNMNEDINMIHNILFTMLTSSKHLLSTNELIQLTNTSQYIANAPMDNYNINNSNNTIANNKISPTPSPILAYKNSNTNMSLAMTPLTLSNNIPIEYSLYCKYKQIEPIQNILELPQHILSYCFSYLATKDLLLSADLCCKELCRIARLPSSFHGKFIFGSAIHSEYHKRINDMNSDDMNNDNDNNNNINMLDRFHHLHEIHFINIFNYDTIQLLKTCNFPKIESIYLYDRFNFLIEYLPSLIPNITKLYIFTKGGNETLDIIEANTNYYNEQLYELFNGYKNSLKCIQLQHNTYYNIPLMLPDKITKLLLHKIQNLNKLTLKNVYFPPDLQLKSLKSIPYGNIKHMNLMPYNEYCSDHFYSSLESLFIYWNIVGTNEIYDMIKLNNLKKLHLLIKLDNDSLDYYSLKQFIIQSQCLLNISVFQLDIDLNDAIETCINKLLNITKHMFEIYISETETETYKINYIKLNIIECPSNLYVNNILPQIINNILNNITTTTTSNQSLIEWNININILPNTQYNCEIDYNNCIDTLINDLKINCKSILYNNKHTNIPNINIQFNIANQISFNLKSNSKSHSKNFIHPYRI